MKIVALLVLFLSQSSAWAWGRRGHSIVCQSAAYLVADEPKNHFLKEHSFDLGYYCNVPDIVWKSPDTIAQESPNHWINIEIFERAMRGSKVKDPWDLDRKSFEKTFPDVPVDAGRVFWRVRELFDLAKQDRTKLMSESLKGKDRQSLQGDWLVKIGVLGHYVGDLGMPMHVIENHDGEITHQKGLHGFFEDVCVNNLFHAKDGKDLESEVFHAAQKRWKKMAPKLAKMSEQELVYALAMDSLRAAPELLKIDRQVGRKDIVKAAQAYKPMIIERMADAAVTLAEFYRRGTGFTFDDHKFYFFEHKPKWIPFPK